MDERSPTRRDTKSGEDAAAQVRWMHDLKDRGVAARSAWGKLFVAYRRKIIGFGLRRSLTLTESEDLLHDVMLAVYTKASQFQFGNTPSPWIMAIARNALLDKLHAKKTRDDTGAMPQDSNERENDADTVEELPASASPPGSTVPQQVTDDCLRRGWQSFVQDHGDDALTMAMRDAEEWTIPELAEHIGRTEAATRQFLSQLRKKLRPYLEPCL